MLKKIAIVPVLLVAPACGAPAGSSESSDAAALTSAPATYSVPVPAELADQATFPVDSVSWNATAERASLKYDLPPELVGTRARVALDGAFDPARGVYALSGPAGTAECTVAGASLTCNERLPGVPVDVARATELAAGSPGAAKRAEVIRRFGVDPIGILTATLRRDDGVDDRRER